MLYFNYVVFVIIVCMWPRNFFSGLFFCTIIQSLRLGLWHINQGSLN